MDLELGRSYTREKIHAILGGELVTYLPQREGRIVCGCFSPDSNPDAPHEILVGEGTAIVHKARVLVEQGGPIPVFLKESDSNWIFSGNFRVRGHTEDRHYIESQQEKARRTDVAMVLWLEPAVRTYLLTWNPKRWEWDDLQQQVLATFQRRALPRRWSCGNTRKIREGDQLFLLRQGKVPLGIMGRGWATRGSYVAPHWAAGREQDTALYVDVRFEELLDPECDEILPVGAIRSGTLADVNWDTPAGGIEITPAATALERLWAAHLRESAYRPAEKDCGVEGAERLALVRHYAREKRLRDDKLAEAQRAHGGALPCEICGFDFAAQYGELGRGYAHVHHLEPLASRTRPSETRLADLAVVCANCHAMIHRGGSTQPLEVIRSVLPGTWLASAPLPIEGLSSR